MLVKMKKMGFALDLAHNFLLNPKDGRMVE